jgi:ketosteroid isomerase-like protein
MRCLICALIISILFSHGIVLAAESDIDAIKAQLVEIAEMTQVARPTAEMTELYMEYFAKEATLLPAESEALRGRAEIAAFYNRAFQGIEILSNNYRDPVVIVNGDMAVRRYIGTAVFMIADTPEPVTATNRYLDVLVKKNGRWKILWHSWVPMSWE